MRNILIVFILLLSTTAMALTKQEIKQSLDQMRKTGMFTEEQINAAETQLMGMSAQEIESISKKGMEAAKDPAMKAKAQKVVERLKKEKSQGN